MVLMGKKSGLPVLVVVLAFMLPGAGALFAPPVHAGPDIPSTTRAVGRWTVLSYMNGDNNLEVDMINDLDEMERIGRIEGVNMVVQLDRSSEHDTSNGNWADTRRFLVADHPAPGLGSTRLDATPLGELNMDDPEVLRDFIVFGLTNYPAEHYMLVLEGHASGPAKGIMKDDSSTLGGLREMEFHDMGTVIRGAIDTTIGRPIDIISFDVCWMGMVEAAFEVMDHTDHLVGSFDEIPRAGWPYDLCLPLILNSTLPMADRLSGVVDAYMTYYEPQGTDYASLAAVDMKAFKDDFTGPFGQLAEEMLYSVEESGGDYNRIMKRVDSPNLKANNANDRYIDLYQFIEELEYDEAVPVRVRAHAAALGRTEGAVLINSRGGANHPAASRLFGIYGPTMSEEALYPSNVLSKLSAWDEYLIVSVRGLKLDPAKVNWTGSDPGRVTFLLKSSTDSLISKVEVETMPLGGGPAKRTALTKSGMTYSVGLDTLGSEGLLYRYIVRTIWGSDVRLPPNEALEVRFGADDDPPVVIHIPPAILDPSRPGGQLEFFISDGTGIDTTTPEGSPRLEFRQKGTMDWYRLPLRAGNYEPLRGIQTFTGFPSGMPPGERVEYHITASDVLGNTVRSPASMEYESTMFKGERFILDAARSDLSGYGKLISLFSSMGISFGVDAQGSLEGLDEAKGYVLLDPVSALDLAAARKVRDFHLSGGVVLIVMDPTDNDQVSKASVLLQELRILVTPEGRVNGYYPGNPTSEISGPLPSLYGKSEGSFEPTFEIGKNDVPVYYSAPPLAAAMTGWNGKGRFLACISSLLTDASMEKGSNLHFAELALSYLARNLAPVISVEVTPAVLLGPGEELTFDLSGSYDRDGEIVSYGLMASDGTSKGGTSHMLKHTFMSSGTYDVELVVEDDGGEVSKETMVIKVNRRPETDHGYSPTEVYAGMKVTFDLKGKDPEGDQVQVVWGFGDGFVLSGKTVEHVYSMRGTYNYTLKVTDSNGLVSMSGGKLVVLNSVPVAIIDREGIRVNGGPGNFSGPSMITLFVSEGDLLRIPSAGSYDRDKADELTYVWEMGDGTVLNVKEALHRFYVSGPRTVFLNITDSAGASSRTQLSVMVYNTFPAADLDASVGKGGKVSFDASSTLDDPWDLLNMTYRWDLGDGTIRTTDAPYLEHDYDWGGSYKVRLTATDPDGDSSTMSMEIDVPGITLFQVAFLVLITIALLLAGAAAGYVLLDRKLAADGRGLLDTLQGKDTGPKERPSTRGFSQMDRRPPSVERRPIGGVRVGPGPKH